MQRHGQRSCCEGVGYCSPSELASVGAESQSAACVDPYNYVLIHTDNTTTVAYINHQGSTVQQIWSRFGQAQVDLFASPESIHCQWASGPDAYETAGFIPESRDGHAPRYTLAVVVWPDRGPPRYRYTGTQSAEGFTQICFSPSEPHCTDSVQSQGGQGTDSFGSPIYAQQNLVLGACVPIINSSLAHSSEEESPFSGEGHNLAPALRPLEPPSDQEDFRDLPPVVVNTPVQARAPSTWWLYSLKWHILVNWCSSQGKDPGRCGTESELSFLHGGLDRHLSASTLKVQLAAISANHDLVEGRLWRNTIWSLDSSEALQQDPFEPFQSVDLSALSMKMALLTALICVKRVGDLQALSVNDLSTATVPTFSRLSAAPLMKGPGRRNSSL
ncbi:F-box/WD repeat-containing protein 10 [Labeo rohita]|uniref:F-box/WD repeat-containing protein 10 n=1 Tax=Labeo rohita TaxID=84645 RepID=A0ABQ8LLW9_LABRO|nr:F-box/WD repeat-containing protein 10 [Labeo rohita]